MSPEKAKKVETANTEDEFVVDMTAAKTLEPLPVDRFYLFEISQWKRGRAKGASGGRVVVVEATAVQPSEFEGRKVIESISIENEYTLGRLKSIVIATGFQTEEEVNVPSYSIPKEEDMLGLQFTGRVNIRASEVYGDRNRLTRILPASSYKEIASV